MTTPELDSSMANFRVGDWQVRPDACEIVRENEVVKLEPRVMDLLQRLASQPGAVHTRIQLEEQVWPGMVVGYDALTKSIGKLRDALGDTNKPARYIETIPKKGYRLIAPVAADSETGTDVAAAPSAVYTGKRSFAAGAMAIVAVLTGIVVLVSLNLQKGAGPDAAPDVTGKHFLLVLPFKNLNADPQQDYFSQGITDDLITDLSGYSGFEVISSRIAYQYRGQDVDIKTLVRELGARYVVEGSIRRTPEQIRINVQMIDARRGTNLWAEQYNRPFSSLFDIQDEVRAKIISALSVKLSEAERNREQKRYTNNFGAYDAFLRGQNSLIKRASAEDNLQAREYFEQAIAIDPGFARAYAALAMANADAYRHDWIADPEGAGRIALQQARYAMELDPGSRHASMAMGYVQFFVAGNHQLAADMARRTLQVDPKNPDANMLLAAIYVHAGELDKAEAYVESSMRLSPDTPSIYFGIAGLANLLRGDYKAAQALYEKSLGVNPGRLFGKTYMVITLVRMNRLEDAKWYADEIRVSSPGFDAGKWARKLPFKDKQINQQLREDLRKVGL